jgi:hypothetical protein
MNRNLDSLFRAGTLLAINLLFVTVWGFAALSKLVNGMPSWFNGKFGQTVLAKFPGLTASFWLLALSELLALALAVAALGRGEFLGRRAPALLSAGLVWSLLVFVQLGFGQWLSSDFNGAFQQFVYFSGTLVALVAVNPGGPGESSALERRSRQSQPTPTSSRERSS